MPSLPALPVKNHALRDVGTMTALLNKGTREYLSRDFHGALATLTILREQPLSERFQQKAFLLYIAVLDSSMTEGLSCEPLASGSLWAEAEETFPAGIPHQVACHLSLSLCRHMTDDAALQALVETHLTRLHPESAEYQSVSELYALHVLPRCQLWEEARGYITSCDIPEGKQAAWLETLEHIQQTLREKLAKAAEEAKAAKKSRKLKKNSRGKKTVIADSSPITPILHDTPIPLVVKRTNPVSILSSLTLLNRRTWQILLFLALLFGATGRRQVRDRMKSALQSVKTTLLAGFKVSYI